MDISIVGLSACLLARRTLASLEEFYLHFATRRHCPHLAKLLIFLVRWVLCGYFIFNLIGTSGYSVTIFPLFPVFVSNLMTNDPSLPNGDGEDREVKKQADSKKKRKKKVN